MFGAGGTGGEYFTYDAASGAVALKSGVSESDLFTYLKNLTKKQQLGDSIKATSTTVKFENLPYGYYLISSTLGATVTIDSTKPHADVIDKNSTSNKFDKQVKLDSDAGYDADDSISANVGDTVDFKVSFNALNYKGEEKVTKYTIQDTLTPSGWASININSITITVKGTELANDAWKLVSGDTNGFEIEIPWVDNSGNFLYDPSVEVEVTYSATVLEAAAGEAPADADNKNTAELTWNDKTEGEEDDTTTKVYNMGFTKVDGTNPNKTLSGAKFELYRDAECTTSPVYVKTTSTEGVYMVDPESTSNEVVTPASGQVVIMGLKAGTYYLKETVAPDGYNLLTDVKSVTVGGANSEMVIGSTTYIVNNGVLTIENNTGVELPSTGGKGTMMLIAIGSMVAMAFAVLLITHKKMSIYHD